MSTTIEKQQQKSHGCWKIEKCFVEKDTDRCIRRTLSTAEKKSIFSWSHKTPKSTIQSHFLKLFRDDIPLWSECTPYPFFTLKSEKTLGTSITQEAFALAHFPRQKTGTNLFNHGGFFREKLKAKSICLFKGILSAFIELICVDFEDSYRRYFGVEYQCVSTI